MDGSNWRRILLYWASQTGLLEKVYLNIEQTDIEAFFEKFRSRMSTTPITQTDLTAFLKEKYPDFQLHLDDENNVSSSDYMYIYILFLHYSCVKCPEPFFHQVCQSLPEQFQQAVASLFKTLLGSESFSKETLRTAISSSAPKSPVWSIPLDSPIRTPRSKFTPPTPKTSMLEERTKELNLLKAQLESERYEKGYLELLLKQNEDKIQKLTQEQKSYLGEIYNLKNELLTRNTENCSPNKNSEDEQIKKRLRKSIAEKEETILNLQENLESLGEEKTLLTGKLGYSEKQVLTCLERIQEMDCIINDLESEIEKRDLAIQTLTETKNELELFISESRSSSQGFRNELNMSAECLDVSLSRTTNSSGSITSSPENLGVSVVDIKLREKENENASLCEQIERMKIDSSKLSKHVCELIVRYANTFGICNENLVVVDESDLANSFMVFENYIEKMIESYTTCNRQLNSARTQNADIQAQNEAMLEQIAEIEKQLGQCRKQLESLQSENIILQKRNDSNVVQMQKQQADIERLIEKHSGVQSTLNNLNEEYASAKQKHEEQLSQLSLENAKLCRDNSDSQSKVVELSEHLNAKSSKVEELEEINSNLLFNIGTHAQEIDRINQKFTENEAIILKLERAVETLNAEKDALLDDLEQTRSNLATATIELQKIKENYENQLEHSNKLTQEISQLNETVNDLEVQLQERTLGSGELKVKLANSNKMIEELSLKLSEVTQSRDHFENCYRSMKEDISIMTTKLAEKEQLLSQKEVDYQKLQQEKERAMKSMKADFEGKIGDYESKISDLNNEMQDLFVKRTEIEKLLITKDKEIDCLQVNIEKINQEKQSSTEDFERKLLVLGDDNKVLRSRRDELENAVTAVAALFKSEPCLNDVGQGDDGKLSGPIGCLNYLKDRMCLLMETNSELSRKSEELHSIITSLKDEISELKKSGEDLKIVCKKFAEDITQSEAKVKALDEEKSTVSSLVENLKERIRQLLQEKSEQEQILANAEIKEKQLNSLIENLTAEKIMQVNEMASLQQTDHQLHEKIKQMQAKIDEYKQIETSLKEQVDMSEKHLTEVSEKHLQLEQSHREMEGLAEKLKLEKENLNNDLEKRQQAAAEDSLKISSLQSKNIDLLDQINQLNNNLAQLKIVESELKTTVAQNEMLKKDLQEKEASVEKISKRISELTNTITMLESAQKSLETTAIDRESKVKYLEETLLKQDAKVKKLENNLLESERSTEALKTKIFELEDAVKCKDNEIDHLKYSVELVENKNKTLTEQHESEMISMKDQVGQLLQATTALEHAKKSAEENTLDIEQSLKHAQSVNVELLSKMDELKSDSAQRDTDYINLQLQHVSICAEKERLSSSKQKLEENYSKQNKRLEKLAVKLGDLQAYSAKLEKTNNESREEIERLKKAAQQNKQKVEDMQKKLTIAQQDLKDANEQIAKERKLYDEETVRNDALNKEMEKNVHRELKVANENVASLQKLYHEEVAKSVALSSELQQIRQRLETEKSQLEKQISHLKETNANLETKLQAFDKVNDELIDSKKINIELQEQNIALSEKIEALISVEDDLREAYRKIEILESDNATLQTSLKELTSNEENMKETASNIDNLKHELEMKVEKLSSALASMHNTLQTVEDENVVLRKENSELKCNLDALYDMVRIPNIKRDTCEETNATETEETTKQTEGNIESKLSQIMESFRQLNNKTRDFESDNLKIASDLATSREENSELIDKLSKLSLRLQILEEQNIKLESEMKELHTACDNLRTEKETVERENEKNASTIRSLDIRQNELLHEHIVSQNSLKEQLKQYEDQIVANNDTIKLLERQLELVRDEGKAKAHELASQNENVQKLKKKCETLEHQVAKERELNEQLKKDITIFQAKLYKNRQMTEEKEKEWHQERNKLKEEAKRAEERIRDNRLELEGKLEKMKEKMKTLYNDEVTKIKNKHEREITEYKTKVEGVLSKNDKYEAHVQKLAKHIFNLNETILELQKQNKFMETKLKDIESIPATNLRRQSQFASQMIGSNLRMEDEEGELFNNTYLADLKSGRVSPFGRDSVSVNELHYRNSLAPPHLRSTYIAQYPDHYLREEDIKDIPINLDDSLSSLLHSGQRKKMSGTTSYKKPGPPTPSKNGGRLSFGGSCDPPREILKESNDASVANTKRSTPSKFRMFSSSRLKDENTPPKRRLSNLFQRKK